MRMRLLLSLAALLALLVPASASAVGNLRDNPALGRSFDARVGSIAPSAAQRGAATALDANARWTRFGTAASLLRMDGKALGHFAGTPAQAARSFVAANKILSASPTPAWRASSSSATRR